MVVNKKTIKEINKILMSFDYIPEKSLFESKKVKMPNHIVSYLENKTNGKIQVSGPYNEPFVEYHVEYFDDTFILVRILDNGEEKRVTLLPEDLALVKDLKDITIKDVKALVKKVDAKEKRFGL